MTHKIRAPLNDFFVLRADVLQTFAQFFLFFVDIRHFGSILSVYILVFLVLALALI
jgi:hypothetical protein